MIIFILFFQSWALMSIILVILWGYFVRLLVMLVMVAREGFVVGTMWVDCWWC